MDLFSELVWVILMNNTSFILIVMVCECHWNVCSGNAGQYNKSNLINYRFDIFFFKQLSLGQFCWTHQSMVLLTPIIVLFDSPIDGLLTPIRVVLDSLVVMLTLLGTGFLRRHLLCSCVGLPPNQRCFSTRQACTYSSLSVFPAYCVHCKLY